MVRSNVPHQEYALTCLYQCEKYETGQFGHCPRVHCRKTIVVPCGRSDFPGVDTVKLYCPNCNDIYTPASSRFQSVDGKHVANSYSQCSLEFTIRKRSFLWNDIRAPFSSVVSTICACPFLFPFIRRQFIGNPLSVEHTGKFCGKFCPTRVQEPKRTWWSKTCCGKSVHTTDIWLQSQRTRQIRPSDEMASTTT